MYSLSNAEIKNRQSQMARLIELLIDITCPIMDKKSWYNVERAEFYSRLLTLKITLIDERRSNIHLHSQKERIIDIDNELLYEVCEFNKVQNMDSSNLYIDCYWERGLSSLVADIIGTSRQNVERHVLLGRIKESRNIDCTILMMLGDMLWEK